MTNINTAWLDAKHDVAQRFIEVGFIDSSYDDDITASFCLKGGSSDSSICYRVQVFHADQSERENNEAFRFYTSVWKLVDGEQDHLITEFLPTNDLSKLLSIFKIFRL